MARGQYLVILELCRVLAEEIKGMARGEIDIKELTRKYRERCPNPRAVVKPQHPYYLETGSP